MKRKKNLNSYIPICLCNNIYKLISKVTTNRLKQILPYIISKDKKPFFKGQNLLDDIFVVHEFIHSLIHHNKEGLILKLNMKKAFDLVNWDFLIMILQTFGFTKH